MFLFWQQKLSVRISIFIFLILILIFLLVPFHFFLTLFMFPLLLRTLLMFTLFVSTLLICSFLFFLLNSFFSKTLCFFFQDLRVSFSRLFHCLFSSLSVKPTQSASPPPRLVPPSLTVFFSLVLSKNAFISLNKKPFSSNIPKNGFSEVLFRFLKNFQNCSFVIFDTVIMFWKKRFWTSEKRCVFFIFFVLKKSCFFLWKMGTTKKNAKKIQISLSAISGVFKKNFFFRKTCCFKTKKLNKKRGDKKVRSEMTEKKGTTLETKNVFLEENRERDQKKEEPIKKQRRWRKKKTKKTPRKNNNSCRKKNDF